MGKLIDLTGQRFGRLVVEERGENDKHGAPQWICRCDCGNRKIVSGGNLRGGRTISCGCAKREENIRRNTTHNQRNTRLWQIWYKIIDRTTNPKNINYSNYGGRGIFVCEEWRKDFFVFKNWALQSGYNDTLTIDRIDNNKGYYPDNCRWVSMKIQQNNKRNNRYITFNGMQHTATEWAEIIQIRPTTLINRLSCGWSIEKALTTPVKSRKKTPP